MHSHRLSIEPNLTISPGEIGSYRQSINLADCSYQPVFPGFFIQISNRYVTPFSAQLKPTFPNQSYISKASLVQCDIPGSCCLFHAVYDHRICPAAFRLSGAFRPRHPAWSCRFRAFPSVGSLSCIALWESDPTLCRPFLTGCLKTGRAHESVSSKLRFLLHSCNTTVAYMLHFIQLACLIQYERESAMRFYASDFIYSIIQRNQPCSIQPDM